MAASAPTTDPFAPLTRELFGGAIVADIPAVFADASTFRPVPSAQEVFVSSSPETDVSIIIDILQRVDPAIHPTSSSNAVHTTTTTSNLPTPPTPVQLIDLSACKIHFEEILDSRDGTIGRLISIQSVPIPPGKLIPPVPTPTDITTAYLLTGTISMPTDAVADDGWKPFTAVYILIIRLPPRFGTDLVLTVNFPVRRREDLGVGPESRIWHPELELPPPAEAGVNGEQTTAGLVGGKMWDVVIGIMEMMWRSLEVRDWELFSPED